MIFERSYSRLVPAMAVMLALWCLGSLPVGLARPSAVELREAKEQDKDQGNVASHFQAYRTNGPQRISIPELDQLTYAYADRYYMVISSAVDAIKRDNPDPAQRRLAHQIKLQGVLSMNDIVSGNNPYSQTLDLVTAVTLESMVLIDENKAELDFGDRAPGLIQAIRTMRVEAWDLAAKVLNQDQLERLDFIILEWRRTHPDVNQVAFVKFDDFAGTRASGLLDEIKAGNGFLAPLSEASQVLKDWGRLTERAFWYSKRAPNIAAIQAEGAVNEILSAPEITSVLQTADRMGKTAEAMPQTVATERHAIFEEIDARQTLLTNSLGDLTHIMADADSLGRTAALLTTNLQQTLLVLGETIKVADTAGHHFGLDKPSPPASGRPFDIQDYNATLVQLNTVLTNLQQLTANADQLTRSEGWNRTVQSLADSTDQRVDHIIFRIGELLLLGFTLAIVYRFLSLQLKRRFRPHPLEKP